MARICVDITKPDAGLLAPAQPLHPYAQPPQAVELKDELKMLVLSGDVDALDAKLADLRAAAEVLKGRKVAAGVQLMVAPASARDQAQAAKEGVMQILIDAGASVLPNACGACAGYGGTFEEGATVISSTARNFQGRMGPASVQVYLASPATVAASAFTGHIADVREVLA
jgi:homoaconitase/3-isopropylmalate dehydratase large subunit